MNMLFRKFKIGAAVAAILLTAACSQITREEIETSLREAEMSVASGDMEVATSVGRHLMSDDNVKHLSATDLARLSVMYMQMADNGNADENTDVASDLYNKAMAVSADSVSAYFQSLPSDKMQYVDMLQAISDIDHQHREIPEYAEVDTLPLDSMFML